MVIRRLTFAAFALVAAAAGQVCPSGADSILAGASLASGTYPAPNYLSTSGNVTVNVASNGSVSGNSAVTFQAGSTICMGPGFSAAATTSGGGFHALIAPVAPVISAISPTSGLVGTQVTVTGTSFGASQGTSAVTVNGIAATVVSWSNTSVSIRIPSGATSGLLAIVVNGIAGIPVSGVSLMFQVAAAAPIVLNPVMGPETTSVTITGGPGFGAAQGTSTVSFNGTNALPTSWNNNQIVVPVPAGATSGNVTVSVAGSPAQTAMFTVTPSITSLSLSTGPAQMGFVITGTTFGAAQGQASINNTQLTVIGWANQSITVQVPVGAVSGPVVVTTTAGTHSNGIMFTVANAFGCAAN